jgi:rubrerythrin
LKGVKSTYENLKETIAGEVEEFKEKYPAFLKVPDDENNKEAY